MNSSEMTHIHNVPLEPLDIISGFEVRPGFFGTMGATLIPCGVSFTTQSHGATSCELLLFHKSEDEPYAVLKFPENYKAMIN